jgi:hypothetical protein
MSITNAVATIIHAVSPELSVSSANAKDGRTSRESKNLFM